MSRKTGRFSFGFGSLAIVNPSTAAVLALIDTVGEITINTKPEIVKASGGPGIFASSARAGRTEGDITLTVNERGNELYSALGFANIVSLTPGAAPTIAGYSNVGSATLADAQGVTLSVTAGQTPPAGVYELEYTALDTFVIRGAGPRGVRETAPLTVAVSANGDTDEGITITRGTSTFTVGDKAVFNVVPASGAAERFDWIADPEPVEVRLDMFSERASQGAPLQQATVNRAILLPPDFMLRSSQFGSEAAELTGTVLIPSDGIPLSVSDFDPA